MTDVSICIVSTPCHFLSHLLVKLAYNPQSDWAGRTQSTDSPFHYGHAIDTPKIRPNWCRSMWWGAAQTLRFVGSIEYLDVMDSYSSRSHRFRRRLQVTRTYSTVECLHPIAIGRMKLALPQRQAIYWKLWKALDEHTINITEYSPITTNYISSQCGSISIHRWFLGLELSLVWLCLGVKRSSCPLYSYLRWPVLYW